MYIHKVNSKLNVGVKGKTISRKFESLSYENLTNEFYQDKESNELSELKSNLESILNNLYQKKALSFCP